MASILAISSYVASGHVGLGAIVPALQAMGHEVIAVPTVVLSCHFGHREVGGFTLNPEQVGSLIDALAANGLLQSVDAVLTGYLPSLEVAEGIARVLGRLGSEQPDVLYLCDPVMGDDPDGLYVSEEVAAAIRDLLVPLADVVTPNRYEHQWMTKEQVTDAETADIAADVLGNDLVAITSVPDGVSGILTICSGDAAAEAYASPRLDEVPHGTGDLFAALLLGHILNGHAHTDAVARAAAGVAHVIERSLGARELNLVSTIRDAIMCEPIDGRSIPRPG